MKKFPVGPETVRMLELGHPWVIADKYTSNWPAGGCGELIALVDQAGRFLATALYDPGNRVVARVLARQELRLSDAWLSKKLIQAQTLRRHLSAEDTDCCRLVNGEGDDLPGLTLDQYGDYLMLQLYTPAWEPHVALLTQSIHKVFQPRGLYHKMRPQDTRRAAKKDSGLDSQLLLGVSAPTPLMVKENGLFYGVDLDRGLHSGIFPDQRRNRQELMARVVGKQVLNLFAFTGAFSLAAVAAGAKKVTSVDVSEKYLVKAKENFVHNGFDPERHEFIVADVFAELARQRNLGRYFDLIIADPPSFSTTRKSRFSTSGGTARLVESALPLLVENGLLLTSSNHQKVGLEDYLKELRKGALAAGSNLKTLLVLGQPEDFPCSVGFPEGRYLKFVISVKQGLDRVHD